MLDDIKRFHLNFIFSGGKIGMATAAAPVIAGMMSGNHGHNPGQPYGHGHGHGQIPNVHGQG